MHLNASPVEPFIYVQLLQNACLPVYIVVW